VSDDFSANTQNDAGQRSNITGILNTESRGREGDAKHGDQIPNAVNMSTSGPQAQEKEQVPGQEQGQEAGAQGIDLPSDFVREFLW
jgi:hypothetical protein